MSPQLHIDIPGIGRRTHSSPARATCRSLVSGSAAHSPSWPCSFDWRIGAPGHVYNSGHPLCSVSVAALSPVRHPPPGPVSIVGRRLCSAAALLALFVRLAGWGPGPCAPQRSPALQRRVAQGSLGCPLAHLAPFAQLARLDSANDGSPSSRQLSIALECLPPFAQLARFDSGSHLSPNSRPLQWALFVRIARGYSGSRTSLSGRPLCSAVAKPCSIDSNVEIPVPSPALGRRRSVSIVRSIDLRAEISVVRRLSAVALSAAKSYGIARSTCTLRFR